jgi:hypothetical protein
VDAVARDRIGGLDDYRSPFGGDRADDPVVRFIRVENAVDAHVRHEIQRARCRLALLIT